MTAVKFVGGMADGEYMEFPEFTILSDLFPLYSADGNGTQLYVLEYRPDANPPHRYLFCGKGK